jgi:hypothetical protein
MADWMNWLAAAGVLVILELLTGTFYLLMIAVGLALGAGAALLGWSAPWQTLVAAVVGIVATGVLHQSPLGRPRPHRQPRYRPERAGRCMAGRQGARGLSRRAVGRATGTGRRGETGPLQDRRDPGLSPDRRERVIFFHLKAANGI